MLQSEGESVRLAVLSCCLGYIQLFLFPHFNVLFRLNYILVYLFYLCPNFCISLDTRKINTQGYGLANRETRVYNMYAS